jgi:hypothetical protein
MDAGKLVAYLGLNTREFDAKLGQQGKVMQNWGGKLAGMLAGVLSVGAIYSFIKESAKIQATYQEIYQGFQRLNDPLLLRNLQDATEGVLDKMTLMKEVVKARNFQVPMDVLATGLKFAKIRAEETGQSVEALSDVLIMSLGRKSARSLVQLGISVSDLKAELGKTGDFTAAVTNIMERGIAKTGEAIETSAEKAERLSAAFKDWRLVIGENINPLLDKLRDKLTNIFKGMTTNPAEEFAMNFLEGFKESTLKGKNFEEQLKLIDSEVEKNTKSAKTWYGVWSAPKADRAAAEAAYQMWDEFTAVIKVLETYSKQITDAGSSTKPTTGYINDLNSKIDLLKESLGELPKEEIKGVVAEIYNYEQQIKDAVDLTPEIEELTKVQSKNAQSLVNDLSQVDTSLKQNSESWASYKYNIWETVQEMAEFSQTAQTIVVDAIDSIAQSIASLITQTSTIEDFFKNFGLLVANFAIQIGKLVAAIGVAMMFIPGMQGKGAGLILAGAGIMTAGYIGKGILQKTPGSSSSSAVTPSSSNYGTSYALNPQKINVQVTGELDGRKLSIASARGAKMLSDMS